MRRHVLLTALTAVAPLLGGLIAVAPASASPVAASTATSAVASPATAVAPTNPVITQVEAGAPRTRAASSGERKAVSAGTADAQVPAPAAIPPVRNSQSRTEPTPSATSQVVQATGSLTFSLVGVTWTDQEAPGTVVSVRTTAANGAVSDPIDLPVGDERTPSGLWGTDAVWTGPGVRAEVTITSPDSTLPTGVVVNLIDPLRAAAPSAVPGSAPAPALAPAGAATVTPASFRLGAATAAVTSAAGSALAPAAARVRSAGYYPVPTNPPTLGTYRTAVPQPSIQPRAAWGADESMRHASPQYQARVKALVVHHSAGSNNYRCSDVPAIIRGIYAYHTRELGWNDIAYNYLIDKCGTIWESAAGGIASSVAVTHAGGFNNDTQAAVLLGNYDQISPSAAMTSSLVKLLAWKASVLGITPGATTALTQVDGAGYARWYNGYTGTFPTIFGHTTVDYTSCPGRYTLAELPGIISRVVALTAQSNAPTAPTAPTAPAAPAAPAAGAYLADGLPGTASTLVPIGSRGDVPLLCDWDGNGTDTLGVFDQGRWSVRNSNRPGAEDWVFSFGNPTDQPICGDWNGNGKDTPGVFRAGHFYLRNSATSGNADGSFDFGNPTDVAVVGSWNGDRFDTVGVARSTPYGKRFYLANSNLTVRASVTATFGNAGDVPLAGDWNRNGTTSIGVFRSGAMYLSDSLAAPRAVASYRFGNATDIPLAGRLTSTGPATVSVARGF